MTVPHPAKFSDNVIMEIKDILTVQSNRHPYRVLDPMAGVGGVHRLSRPEYLGAHIETVGVELEPEWAVQHEGTIVGNALDLPFGDEEFDAIVVSPAYGNRMADSHEAKDDSKRITYTHQLGRKLTDGNSGAMQWGAKYMKFHLDAWVESTRVLKPGGLFVPNVKNHIRNDTEQPVVEFHMKALIDIGFHIVEVRKVRCPGMGFGQHREKRVEFEQILVLRKPRETP